MIGCDVAESRGEGVRFRSLVVNSWEQRRQFLQLEETAVIYSFIDLIIDVPIAMEGFLLSFDSAYYLERFSESSAYYLERFSEQIKTNKLKNKRLYFLSVTKKFHLSM